MLVYEYKLDAAPAQYARMDTPGTSANDLQVQCNQLAQDYPFAAKLNAQARQAAADRAWQAISRFYANCRAKVPGRRAIPVSSATIGA